MIAENLSKKDDWFHLLLNADEEGMMIFSKFVSFFRMESEGERKMRMCLKPLATA